jgi:hypothetical protein
MSEVLPAKLLNPVANISPLSASSSRGRNKITKRGHWKARPLEKRGHWKVRPLENEATGKTRPRSDALGLLPSKGNPDNYQFATEYGSGYAIPPAAAECLPSHLRRKTRTVMY